VHHDAQVRVHQLGGIFDCSVGLVVVGDTELMHDARSVAELAQCSSDEGRAAIGFDGAGYTHNFETIQ